MATTTSTLGTPHARELSIKATMKGLEHEVDFDKEWATFNFTSENAKRCFDEMALDSGYSLRKENDIEVVIESVEDLVKLVVQGTPPEEACGLAHSNMKPKKRKVSNEVKESIIEKLTNGMKNALI